MAFTYRDVVAAAGVGDPHTTAQLLTTGNPDHITTMATAFTTAAQHARTIAGEQGGEQLAGFANGINASRAVDPHLSVVGHSYGSRVAGEASVPRAGVDDAVHLGSLGLGTDDPATDIAVPPGRTYVADAQDDAQSEYGWFGGDPGDPDSYGGVTDLGTGAAVAPDGTPLRANRGHDADPALGPEAYLAPDTTTRHNVVNIIAGADPDQLVLEGPS